MASTIQRSVTYTGTNTTSNPNFEWVNVDNVDWVQRSDTQTTGTSDFSIADNTGATRTSQWEVRHWNYVNDNTLVDSFTITQTGDGVVSTTTTTTAASTTTTVAQTTTTVAQTTTTVAQTTQAPINYTLQLASGTTGGNPIVFDAATPGSASIGYAQSPNSGTPPFIISTQPPWITVINITGSVIQITLNSDESTWPSESIGTTIDFRHGDAPSGQGEDTLYLSFVPVAATSMLLTSGNLTVNSEFSGGQGWSSYYDDNSGELADMTAIYTVNMSPDTTLTSAQVYWSDTLPNSTGHTASLPPYWATEPTIDNAYSTGGNEASVTFSHIDPNASSGGTTTTTTTQVPLGKTSSPLTEETAEAQAGPSGPGPSGNTKYLIITHPDDTAVVCSVLVTAPTTSITTTTTTPPTPTFSWRTPGGNSGTGTPTLSYPAHYNGANGTSGNLSSSNSGYVAGPNFFLWGNYLDSSGNAITTDPNNDLGTNMIFPSYITHDQNTSPVYNTTVGAWKFEFNTDSTNPGFPTSTGSDYVANIYQQVTGVQLGYGVIIDQSLSCHVTGTLMNLADGSTKLVEDLQVGDVLASYDIAGLGHDETTSTWEEYSSQINQFSASAQTAEVVAIQSSEFGKYVNFNNGLTKVTEEHPVLIKDAGNNISFKQVFMVVIGDSFYINGAWVEITSKEVVEETITAYRLDVEELDVYLADGILWHNDIGVTKVED